MQETILTIKSPRFRNGPLDFSSLRTSTEGERVIDLAAQHSFSYNIGLTTIL